TKLPTRLSIATTSCSSKRSRSAQPYLMRRRRRIDPAATMLPLLRPYRTEQSVRFVIQACAEEQGVGRRRSSVGIQRASKRQRPETVVNQRAAVRTRQRAEPLARFRIERVERAVTEIADENVIGELAEGRRRHRDAPRRIEMPMLREASQQIAVHIEDVDEAMRRLVDRV